MCSLVLDVGCGAKPRGDVNLDLTVESTHRQGNRRIAGTINLVLGDACRLPFRDGSFRKVVSFQTLEHVPDPWAMLKELYRVAREEVLVEVPSRHSLPPPWRNRWMIRRSRTHVNNFDAAWFREAIPLLLGTQDFEAETIYRGLLHPLLPPLWPDLIRVRIRKSYVRGFPAT